MPSEDVLSQMISDQAQVACQVCKKRKGKCDKGVPQCSFCMGKNLRCIYWSSDVLALENSRQNEQLDVSPSTENSFPAVFFLDHDVFQHGLMKIPRPVTTIPLYVSNLVGDFAQVRDMAMLYFNSVHSYMPIISKKIFYNQLLNPLLPPRGDVLLLCLCMKLITWSPSPNNKATQTEAYLSAKKYAIELELSGIFTIQVLQCLILIFLYEFGHGIYPSAYMTIKACAAYGTALGVDFRSAAKSFDQTSWVETEEKRRVWWAILILERVMTLGSPERKLVTDDPTPYDLLPADDSKWDQGIIGSNCAINMSTSDSDINLGRFARQAHATHLLGQVFQNVSQPYVDGSSQHDETKQLDRTLRALIVLCELESERTSLRYCNPIAICSSALFVLHSRYILPDTGISVGLQQYRDSWNTTKHIAQKTAMSSNMFLDISHQGLDQISPVVLHATYQSAMMFIRMIRESKSVELNNNLEVLKLALKSKNRRWQAAGFYLQIIEAQAVMNYY